MKLGVAFIPISYCRGLGWQGRECPPPLTVFTDMPDDYKLGREFTQLSSFVNNINTNKPKQFQRTFFLLIFFFFYHILFPLTIDSLWFPHSLMHKLQVDFICPFSSLFNTCLSHHCHATLCASDNGSNYSGFMSVAQHSTSSTTGRMQRREACCLASSSHTL